MRVPAARRQRFPRWSDRPRGSVTSDARSRGWQQCRASWEFEDPAREQPTVARKSGSCVEAQGSTAWATGDRPYRFGHPDRGFERPGQDHGVAVARTRSIRRIDPLLRRQRRRTPGWRPPAGIYRTRRSVRLFALRPDRCRIGPSSRRIPSTLSQEPCGGVGRRIDRCQRRGERSQALDAQPQALSYAGTRLL